MGFILFPSLSFSMLLAAFGVPYAAWWAAVHGVAKSQTRLSNFTFAFHFHAVEKEMATHSSVLAWRIPGTREPGGLPSMRSHRVGHDGSNLAATACLPLYAFSFTTHSSFIAKLKYHSSQTQGLPALVNNDFSIISDSHRTFVCTPHLDTCLNINSLCSLKRKKCFN